jgi:hypothetical protein
MQICVPQSAVTHHVVEDGQQLAHAPAASTAINEKGLKSEDKIRGTKDARAGLKVRLWR